MHLQTGIGVFPVPVFVSMHIIHYIMMNIIGDYMGFETISPRDIDSYLFKEGYTIIDVRSPREYRRNHIKGSICIPYERIEYGVNMLKNQTLILYCERGSASMMAAKMLGDRGYQTMTMVGGIIAYKGKNLESNWQRYKFHIMIKISITGLLQRMEKSC